jgi:hypothetical protein
VIGWTEKAGVIERGESMTVNTSLGHMSVTRFTLDGRFQCGALSMTWGIAGMMRASEGNRRLLGYICEETDKPVTRARLEKAANAIAIAE